MQVSVKTEEGVLSFEAQTIEVARLVASAHGFNVDVEPWAGNVKLVARRGSTTIHCSGATVNEAAAKLIKGFCHE